MPGTGSGVNHKGASGSVVSVKDGLGGGVAVVEHLLIFERDFSRKVSRNRGGVS